MLTLPDKGVVKAPYEDTTKLNRDNRTLESQPNRKPQPESGIPYNNTATLTGHIEGVRDLFFHPTKPILASVA